MGLAMSKNELIQTTGIEAAKGTPPIVVAATAQSQSWSSADTITLLTITYLTLQILWLLWRWWKAHKTGQQVP